MSVIAKKVKHGIKWQVISNIAGQSIYFINGIVLARVLSPKDFGLWGMSQLISNFAFMFWDLGLNSAIIQKKDINDNDLNTVFSFCLITGFVCFAFIWFAAPFMAGFFKEPIIVLLARLLGVLFLIYALDRVPTALLSRDLHFKKIGIVGIVNPAIYGAVTIPLALLGFGPKSFAIGLLAGTMVMAFMRVYWGFKLFSWRPKILIDKLAAKQLFGFGIFVTMTNIINYFLGNLQRIITGKYFGAIDLGYLERATTLGAMPQQKINASIGGVLLPAFSNIQDDKKKIKVWFQKFNFFTYAIIAPVLILFIFFPKEVIAGLFGQKWIPSSPLLQWLSAMVLVTASTMYFTNIISAIGKPHIIFTISTLRLIPFIILLLFSIKWGIHGVVIAMFLNGLIGFSF